MTSTKRILAALLVVAACGPPVNDPLAGGFNTNSDVLNVIVEDTNSGERCRIEWHVSATLIGLDEVNIVSRWEFYGVAPWCSTEWISPTAWFICGTIRSGKMDPSCGQGEIPVSWWENSGWLHRFKITPNGAFIRFYATVLHIGGKSSSYKDTDVIVCDRAQAKCLFRPESPN